MRRFGAGLGNTPRGWTILKTVARLQEKLLTDDLVA